MDRTTLTRNLNPLEKAKLVMAAESSDRRERLLCRSPEGRRRLRNSYVSWENAQKELILKIGPDALEHLRAALEVTERAAATVLDEG